MTNPVAPFARKISPSLALAAAIVLILITVGAIVALTLTERSDASVISSLLMTVAPSVAGLLAYAGVQTNRQRIEAASQHVEQIKANSTEVLSVARGLSNGSLEVNVRKALTDALNDVAPKVNNDGR